MLSRHRYMRIVTYIFALVFLFLVCYFAMISAYQCQGNYCRQQ